MKMKAEGVAEWYSDPQAYSRPKVLYPAPQNKRSKCKRLKAITSKKIQKKKKLLPLKNKILESTPLALGNDVHITSKAQVTTGKHMD